MLAVVIAPKGAPTGGPHGGIGPGWGGVLVILLASVMAVLVILDKVRL